MPLKMINKQKVESDIWEWITTYIEQNSEFYNNKLPPCPYARAARLKGLVDVKAYESGSYKDFINASVNELVEGKKINTRVLAFPIRLRWYYHIHRFVNKSNRELIDKDFYMQYGIAKKNKDGSKFKYFIVIVNKLSDVLNGHKALLETDYYKPWSKKHYNEVVVRRQKMYDKYHSKK
jgi:hypothetical protein